MVRGNAIWERIYPNSNIRRRLYRTSVAPRFGKKIVEGYVDVREHLITGDSYSSWSTEEQLIYIIKCIKLISGLGKFTVSDGCGREGKFRSWDIILRWWLHPNVAVHAPTKDDVSDWIKFVKQNFEYRFNWGLGTVIALVLDEVNGGVLQETSIKDWPKTGLPWIVFWLKELIVWGTLDPVAAFLLAHGIDNTRFAAEKRAEDYYAVQTDLPSDEVINPIRIKNWADQFINRETSLPVEHLPKEIKVRMLRDTRKSTIRRWRVVPIVIDSSIVWIDPAGYKFAISDIPSQWCSNSDLTHDFMLDLDDQIVKVSKFI